MSGGSEANRSGLSWEAWVEIVAKQQNLPVLKHSEYIQNPLQTCLVTHVPYHTIYNVHKKQAEAKTSTEFVIHTETKTARIECKWQNTGGSVDEKFPFMLLNAVLTMPEDIIIFALGGAFYEKGRGLDVKNWLETACKTPPEWLSDSAKKQHQKKQLIVLTPNTFARWFRENF